ncbi:hypothetical protein HPB47_021002 [Ixodes persulcatus]|uniref:Uncharacterized protein n=1 Tax=Ixodes persulcatus TaxID=34615 RepID=A0AC60QG10_IXOPE|nr:hypothetical protein HPB47_021002 [Ixodes persulcatus]
MPPAPPSTAATSLPSRRVEHGLAASFARRRFRFRSPAPFLDCFREERKQKQYDESWADIRRRHRDLNAANQPGQTPPPSPATSSTATSATKNSTGLDRARGRPGAGPHPLNPSRRTTSKPCFAPEVASLRSPRPDWVRCTVTSREELRSLASARSPAPVSRFGVVCCKLFDEAGPPSSQPPQGERGESGKNSLLAVTSPRFAVRGRHANFSGLILVSTPQEKPTYRCTPYRHKTEACTKRWQKGYRQDVCPHQTIRCPNCGLENPNDNHPFTLRCVGMRRAHLMGTPECPKRFQPRRRPPPGREVHQAVKTHLPTPKTPRTGPPSQTEAYRRANSEVPLYQPGQKTVHRQMEAWDTSKTVSFGVEVAHSQPSHTHSLRARPPSQIPQERIKTPPLTPLDPPGSPTANYSKLEQDILLIREGYKGTPPLELTGKSSCTPPQRIKPPTRRTSHSVEQPHHGTYAQRSHSLAVELQRPHTETSQPAAFSTKRRTPFPPTDVIALQEVETQVNLPGYKAYQGKENGKNPVLVHRNIPAGATKELDPSIPSETVDSHLQHQREVYRSMLKRWRKNKHNHQWGQICGQMRGNFGLKKTWLLLRHLLDPDQSKSKPKYRMTQLMQTFPGSDPDFLDQATEKYLPIGPQNSIPPYPGQQKTNMDSDITEAEVRLAISKLKPISAPGPDGITNRTLRNLDNSSIINITDYINTCLREARIPEHILASLNIGYHKLLQDKSPIRPNIHNKIIANPLPRNVPPYNLHSPIDAVTVLTTDLETAEEVAIALALTVITTPSLIITDSKTALQNFAAGRISQLELKILDRNPQTPVTLPLYLPRGQIRQGPSLHASMRLPHTTSSPIRSVRQPKTLILEQAHTWRQLQTGTFPNPATLTHIFPSIPDPKVQRALVERAQDVAATTAATRAALNKEYSIFRQ